MRESKLTANEAELEEKVALEKEVLNKVREYKKVLETNEVISRDLTKELGLVEKSLAVEADELITKFTKAESNLRAVLAQVESGEVNLSESTLVDLKQGLEQLEAINLQYKTNLAILENAHKTHVVNSKGESLKQEEKPEATRISGPVLMQESKLTANEAELEEKVALEKEVLNKVREYKKVLETNEVISRDLAKELGLVEKSLAVEVDELISKFTKAESNLRAVLAQVESGEVNLSESTLVDLKQGLEQLEAINLQYKTNLAILENAHKTHVVNSKGESLKQEEKPSVAIEFAKGSSEKLESLTELYASELLSEKAALEEKISQDVETYSGELLDEAAYLSELLEELKLVNSAEVATVITRFKQAEANLRHVLDQVEFGEINLSETALVDLKHVEKQLETFNLQYKANVEAVENAHNAHVAKSNGDLLKLESLTGLDASGLLSEKAALEEKISQDVETYSGELLDEAAYLSELLEELKLVNSAEVKSVITRFERAESNLRHVLSQVEKGKINLSEATLVDLKLGLQQLEIFNSQYKANVETVENTHNAYVSKSKGESLKEEEKPAIAIEFNKGSSEKLESLTELDATGLLSEKSTLEEKISQDVETYSGELFDEAAYLNELLEELKLVNSAEVESVITRFKQAESNLRHVLDQVESGEINLSETTLAELKYVEKQLETFNLQYKANVEAVENAHNAHVAKSNGDLLKLESLTGLDASGLLSEKAALEEKISQNVKSYKEELVKEEATSSKLLEELKQVGSAELESVITRFTRAEAGLRHVLTQVETGKINLSESTLVELKYVIKQLEAFNLQYKSTLANLESVHKVHVVNSKGESLKQEENPSIEVVSQKGDSVVETKPEITIANGKGSALVEAEKPKSEFSMVLAENLVLEAKPEVTIASEKGTPLVQEEKPEAEFSMVLAQNVELEELPAVEKFSGNALTQEAKPEAKFSMVLAENLVLEAKPEIKVETTKGTSVVETEKPKSEFSMVLAQNVELEELPAVEKFSGNALTQEAKPEAEFSMVLAENLVLKAKPEIKVETTKGTSVVETEKPKSEFSMVLAQNVELEELPAVEKFSGNALTQEAKPEAEFSMVLAENLVLEAKPELQLSSKKGEALVQEVKPELKVEKTKGTSLVQETKPEISLKSNKVSQQKVAEKTRTVPAKKVVKSTANTRVLPKTSASTQQGTTQQGLILGAASLLAAVTLRRKQK